MSNLFCVVVVLSLGKHRERERDLQEARCTRVRTEPPGGFDRGIRRTDERVRLGRCTAAEAGEPLSGKRDPPQGRTRFATERVMIDRSSVIFLSEQSAQEEAHPGTDSGGNTSDHNSHYYTETLSTISWCVRGEGVGESERDL